MRQTILRSLPNVSVIAYSEIPTDMLIDATDVVRYDEVINEQDSAIDFQIATPTPPPENPNGAEGN